MVELIRRGVKSKTLIVAYYRLKERLEFGVPAVAHDVLDTKYKMIGRQENTYATHIMIAYINGYSKIPIQKYVRSLT
jgi:hypothetical protein